MDITDALAIAALLLTCAGFFASLFFYLDARDMQDQANRVLTAISEKSSQIHTTVEGVLTKALEAALEKSTEVDDLLADLQDQLEETQAELIREASLEIGKSAGQERRRLEELITTRLSSLEKFIYNARQSAQEVAHQASSAPGVGHSTEQEILSILRDAAEPLEIEIIRSHLPNDYKNLPDRSMRRLLRNLEYKGLITRTIASAGQEVFHI